MTQVLYTPAARTVVQAVAPTRARVESTGHFSIYDPAVLALSGWWRDYPPESGGAPVPWASSASAGPSVGRTLYHGVSSPTQGALYNGHRSAGFDGVYNSTNSQEGSGELINQYITATAWTRWYVFKASVLNAPGDNPTLDPNSWASRALFDDLGYTYLCDTVDTAGIHIHQYDAGGRKIISSGPIVVGTVYRVIARFDGAFMRLRVNGVDVTPVASGTITSPYLAIPYRLGDSYSTAHFGGDLLEHGVSQVSLTDAQVSLVDSYFVSRYGV